MYIKKSFVLIIKLPDKFPLTVLLNQNVIQNTTTRTLKTLTRSPPVAETSWKTLILRRQKSSNSQDEKPAAHVLFVQKEDDPVSALFKAGKSKILKSHSDGHAYHERVILGYSRKQMCDLVSDVGNYHKFVPFCIASEIIPDEKTDTTAKLTTTTTKSNPLKLSTLKTGINLGKLKASVEKPVLDISTPKISVVSQPQTLQSSQQQQQPILKLEKLVAKLEIGYPPIRESYVSHVEIIRPEMVKAISRDTRLFEFLINEWRFHPNQKQVGLKLGKINSTAGDQFDDKSCVVEFYVSFKFKSAMYNQFAILFLDQVFKKMVAAFTERAAVKYGPASVEPRLLAKSLD